MRVKVVQKYFPLWLGLGLNLAYAMNSQEWVRWSGDQQYELLQKELVQNPRALERIELDQSWLFSSKIQAWDFAQSSARYYGFPFRQSLALGHGDSLGKKALWRMNYRYERMGWAQDDFLLYANPAGLYRAQSAHLSTLQWSYGQYGLSFGAWSQKGEWSGLLGLQLGSVLGQMRTAPTWGQTAWAAMLWSEKRALDTAGQNSWAQYLPRIGSFGRGSAVLGASLEQNLYRRYVYAQASQRGSDFAYGLQFYADPSRMGAFRLGAAKIGSKLKWGGALDLIFLTLAYQDPRASLEGSPFAGDWSLSVHFGLEGFANKAVQRPGASLPLMPEEKVTQTKVKK